MDIRIETVTTLEQCDQCRALAAEVWGSDAACSTPQMMVHASYGGVVLLAYHGNRPIGFLFSFPAVYKGEVVLWSHETAVLPEFLHHGVGTQLKRRQRDLARELSYRQIAWTFDPLVSRNAYFNLHKLGAKIVEYKRNAYGTDPSDRINRGLETDRWIAVWGTDDDAGPDVSGQTIQAPYTWLQVGADGAPVMNKRSNRSVSRAVTQIPLDFGNLLVRDWDVARQWRSAFRETAEALWAAGYRPSQYVLEGQLGSYRWEKGEVCE